MPYSQIDRNQVNFYLFPINNNRTAWRPIGFPVLLIVPRRTTYLGEQIEDSNISNVEVYIESVAQNAYVAGQDHILQDGTQLRYPSKELYRVQVSLYELGGYKIQPNTFAFYDPAGNTISESSAREGDFLEIVMASGVRSKIPYFPDADYYDLSNIKLDIEILPSGYFNIIYSCDFYYRNVDSTDSSFVCISQKQLTKATLRLGIDHPGHVLHEFYKHTPPPYLTNSQKSQDTTVDFYRPFTDILNDVYDEQKLLESINWVENTPLEFIPYLAYLLGWELPYFPQTKGAKSLDSIRRAIIRTTTYFQNLKGSEKAIKELFKIFGLDIYLERLWYSSDGQLLIRPNEILPTAYSDQQISAYEVGQVDLLANGVNAESSLDKIRDPNTQQVKGAKYTLDTNLLFAPTELTTIANTRVFKQSNDITIEAYTVAIGSAEDTYLKGICDELQIKPDSFDYDLKKTTEGTLYSQKISPLNYKSKSSIRITGTTGIVTTSLHAPDSLISPLNDSSRYDTQNNKIKLSYNGYLEPGYNTYIFAYYKRIFFNIPDIIKNLQSRNFNLQILTKDLQEQVDPKTLNFALDFLKKIQAFSSRLHLIRTSAELHETYEVTDLSVGGDTAQRSDTDIGRLQVPEAIIPLQICGSPIDVGYKPEDINLRLKKLEDLKEEHYVSYQYNNRNDDNFDARLSPNKKHTDNPPGYYADYNQNIIAGGRTEESTTANHPDPNANSQIYSTQNRSLAASHESTNNSNPVLSTNRDSGSFGSFTVDSRKRPVGAVYPLDGFTDYSYKGRVDDQLLTRRLIDASESIHPSRKSISLGYGSYYTLPRIPRNISNVGITGMAPAVSKPYYNTTPNDLSDIESRYGRLLRSYTTDATETIHYTNREYEISPDQRYNLALTRPSLIIEKSTMHLPGCRFLSIGKLEQDYINNTVPARPWDDAVNICSGCSITNTLNARLIGEVISFDAAQYTAYGNGRKEDILDLGESQALNSFIVDDQIIHRIFTTAETSIYIQEESLDHSGTVGPYVGSEPLFPSASNCGDYNQDFIDGYASVSGAVSDYAGTSYIHADVVTGLGVPFSVATSYRFMSTLASGVLIEAGLRLDMGLVSHTCGTAFSSSLQTLEAYADDYFPDQVNSVLVMRNEEKIGAGVVLLDGAIDNLLGLI